MISYRFFTLIAMLGLFISQTLAANDTTAKHNKSEALAKKRQRSCSSKNGAARELCYSYDDLYHRHDSSACYHLGRALTGLGPEMASQFKDEPAQQQIVKDDLEVARRYCAEDHVSRHDAVEHLRNAIRVMNGHPSRSLASEPEPARQK